MTSRDIGYVAAQGQQLLRAVLCDRPIAYHPMLARALGGVTTGVFLSQLLYWSGKGHDPTGWIYKTQAEWEQETGLTRLEQETARKHLRDAGVLEEKREGLPARLFYRVDFSALTNKLECGKPTSLDVGNQQSSKSETDIHSIEQRVPTEITTEIPLAKRSRRTSQSQEIVPVDRAKLHERYDISMGAGLVDEQIDLALAHKAAKNYTNLHLYVINWLRKESGRLPANYKFPARNGAPAPATRPKIDWTKGNSPPLPPERVAAARKLNDEAHEKERQRVAKATP